MDTKSTGYAYNNFAIDVHSPILCFSLSADNRFDAIIMAS